MLVLKFKRSTMPAKGGALLGNFQIIYVPTGY